MVFTNPFRRVKSLDNNGYLRVSVKNFRELNGAPTRFYESIDELVHIREALNVAYQASMLDSLAGGAQFYRMAIEWLALNKEITDGYRVTAIENYDGINDVIAEEFWQFIQWMKQNYLSTQPFYQTIQAQLGVKKLDALGDFELKTDALHDDFKQSLQDAQTRLAENSDQRTSELTSSLSSMFSQQTQDISIAKQEAVGAIEQAQTLSIWHDAYQAGIDLYTQKLYGVEWVPLEVLSRIKDNLKPRLIGALALAKNNWFRVQQRWWYKIDWSRSKKEAGLGWYVMSRSARFVWIALSSVLRYVFSKTLFSIRGQRIGWFLVLGLILVGQSILFLGLLLRGQIPDVPLGSLLSRVELTALTSNEFVFAKISIFLGLILVPSLGYAFASRNFRIYSNLLEQYRHRATVAQTLQGILRSIDEGDMNKDIRVSLTTVAAVAMFEMKNVGHLTKREGDTLPVGEILQGVISPR